MQNGRQLKAIIIGQPDYSATAYMFVTYITILSKKWKDSSTSMAGIVRHKLSLWFSKLSVFLMTNSINFESSAFLSKFFLFVKPCSAFIEMTWWFWNLHRVYSESMFPQVMLSYFVTPFLLTVMNSNYLYYTVHSCQFSATLQGVTLAILQMMYVKLKHIFSVILDTCCWKILMTKTCDFFYQKIVLLVQRWEQVVFWITYSFICWIKINGPVVFSLGFRRDNMENLFQQLIGFIETWTFHVNIFCLVVNAILWANEL